MRFFPKLKVNQSIMEFLFNIQGLSSPLIQEIVWLTDLNYGIMDCLKPPYFIPKNSIPIENYAGHNLATHAKLENPKWLGVPPDTPNKTIHKLIQNILNRQANIERFHGRILYSTKTDKQILMEQREKYNWQFDWVYKVRDGMYKTCTINNQNQSTWFRELNKYKYKTCSFNNQNRLTWFYVTCLKLQYLDVSLFSQLTYLNCAHTQITELNVTNNTQLRELFCGDNPIKTLDISHCTQLVHLGYYGTQINEIDISQCKQLKQIGHSTNVKLIGYSDDHDILFYP